MTKIGIFFTNPFKMGGTETWVRNVCSEYADKYDITVYYHEQDLNQLIVPKGSVERLNHMVKTVGVFPGDKVEVDIGIWAFDYFHMEDVEAKEKILFIHPGDGHGTHPRTPDGYSQFDKVVGVSQYTVDKMKEWCPGLEVLRVYNPVPKQKLKLVSLSRSDKTKGWKRAKGLAEALNRRGVDYEWRVFTDSKTVMADGFTYCKPTIHVEDEIRKSDFLVQLSDYESFGFSLVEGMQFAKLITTDIEILPEMGITSENSVLVPLECDDYDKVVDDILSRMYVPPQTDYSVLFGESNGERNLVTVKNTTLGDILLPNDVWVEGGSTITVDNSEELEEYIKSGILRKI